MRPTPLVPAPDATDPASSGHRPTGGGEPSGGRDLSCYRVALLVSDGFERSELHEPLQALRDAGAEAVVITPDGSPAKAWSDGGWSDTVEADRSLSEANPAHYDALVLPGGVINPDQLRTEPEAVALVKGMVRRNRPVAAICHGPWSLVEADAVRERTVTSWPSLRTDLENAGATWVDQEVVVDGPLITSRNPGDLPAFCRAVLGALGTVPGHDTAAAAHATFA